MILYLSTERNQLEIVYADMKYLQSVCKSSKEFSILFTNQHQYLKSKVTNCYSLEEFQKAAEKFKENNQRLMIVSKPMYFANNYCLVKVAFYRSIEHNSGSYFLFENLDGEWKIKETLNEWST